MLLHVVSSALSNYYTRTATVSSTDGAISTPSSSECDEGVTIHADPVIVAVGSKSLQSSPLIKKESIVKQEA